MTEPQKTLWNSGDPNAATCGWPTSRGPCYLSPNHAEPEHDGAYVGEAPAADKPSAFPEVVIDPRVPDDEVHLVSGDSRTVIRVGLSEPAEVSLDALARAVDCDTAETVRWEIAETLDKCAGTKERILAQIQAGEDCDTCPPGFLAVVMQAENLARALNIALDLLKVPAKRAEVEG